MPDLLIGGVQRGNPLCRGYEGVPQNKKRPWVGGWEGKRPCSGDNADAPPAHGASRRHPTSHPRRGVVPSTEDRLLPDLPIINPEGLTC